MLNRIIGWAAAAAAIVLPIAFLPESVLRLTPTKAFWIVLTVFVATAAWLAVSWSEKRIRVPRSYMVVGTWLLVVVAIASAIFSRLPMTGLVGQGFESDTAFILALGALLTLVISYATRQGQRAWTVYVGLAAVFALISLSHFIRFIFGADTLTFGMFSQQTQNLIGSWNDLGIFAGLITLLSMLTLMLVPFKGFARVAAYVVFGLGLLFTLLVNYPLVWYLVGATALVACVYNAAKKKPKSTLIVPAIAVVIAIVGITLGNTIVSSVNSFLPISVIEVRPTLGMTYEVGKATLSQKQVLGSGSNQFFYEWLENKPESARLDQVFWNTDFTAGYGYIPTMFVTLGVLGVLVWLLIIVVLAKTAVRVFRYNSQSLMGNYFLLTSLVGTLFLTIILLVYVPSLTIVFFWYIFLGLLLASLVRENLLQEKVFAFGADASRKWVGYTVFGLTAVLALGIFALGAMHTLASAYAQRAVTLANKTDGDPVQNLIAAEASLNRAAAISGQSLYYRSMVSIDLAKMSLLVAEANASSTDLEVLRGQFQQVVVDANNHITASIDANPFDYQNYVVAGNFYATLAGLGATGELETAVVAFDKAKEVNPHNPLLPLIQARIEASAQDLATARLYVEEAIKKKNNYIDAYFFLAQIQAADDDIAGAVKSVESAIAVDQQNPLLYFQLGLLHYNTKAYAKARTAFEQALTFTPVYANARYFLGLSLYELDLTEEAIAQFEQVSQTNPESEEVKAILTNLRAGRAPFAGVPQAAEPEDRTEPPLDESDEN